MIFLEGRYVIRTQIVHNNKVEAVFTYDALSRITSITNDSGYKLTFGYVNESRRVAYVGESKNGELGREVSFERGCNNTVTRTSGANGIFGDADDLLTTYVYNNKVQVVSTQCETADGEKLGAVAMERDANSTTFDSISKVHAEGKIPDNVIKNHNVESTQYWSPILLDDSNCVNTKNYTTEEAYVGEGSLKIKIENLASSGAAAFYQNLALNAGTVEKKGNLYFLGIC